MSEQKKSVSRRSIGARRNPETEAAVLRAAGELLAQKGPRGLTMEAVARRARASKATLYRWWPSRGALLIAVYAHLKGDIDYADTGSLIGDIADFYDQLQAMWAGRDGTLFRLIIAEAQSDEDVAEALGAYRAGRQAQVATIFTRAQARGELIDRADPMRLAEAVVALAWMRLLTGRLGQKGIDMARPLLAGWMRP